MASPLSSPLSPPDPVGSASYPEPPITISSKSARNKSTAEIPKAFNLDDPFHFAPPTPDGDPWTLLLEPLLKKDQQRCDSWRDEVQNLLIFAGLFSAVVTTFIIESYKGLQQDPNSVMISLLTHIAERLDGSLTPGTNSTPVPISIPKFTAQGNSIRVNSFWFSSLVLSLMTVLIGTISLQWLREHLTYSDLNPRQMYAVYHMRHRALETWHVDKIFTALPLLLQSALVLFLLGVFEFLQQFAQPGVIVPVAVLMSLTFFFLFATTVLPSVQPFGLFVYYRRSAWSPRLDRFGDGDPATPCPYKSLQSDAIRIVVNPLFLSFFLLSDAITSRTRGIGQWIRMIMDTLLGSTQLDTDTNHPEDEEDGEEAKEFKELKGRFPHCLWDITGGTLRWVERDEMWLVIRDEYMKLVYKRTVPYEFANLRTPSDGPEVGPLFDLVRGLLEHIDLRATCNAAYACFLQVSEETLQPLRNGYPNGKYRFRYSGYLHDLVSMGTTNVVDVFNVDDLLASSNSTLALSELQAELGDHGHEGSSREAVPGVAQKNMEKMYTALHMQNLYGFVRRYDDIDRTLFCKHAQELALRLSVYFYTSRARLNRRALGVDPSRHQAQGWLPRCLTFTCARQDFPPKDRKAFNVIACQAAHTLLSFLQSLDASHLTSDHMFLQPSIQTAASHAFIKELAKITTSSLLFQHRTDNDSLVVDEKFDEVFGFIAKSLLREMASWPQALVRRGSSNSESKSESDRGQGQTLTLNPSLLFYIAALYVSMQFLYWTRWLKRPAFNEMRVVICMYKNRMMDTGVRDLVLEERLAAKIGWSSGLYSTKKPFSEEWWTTFEKPGYHASELYHRAIEATKTRYGEV